MGTRLIKHTDKDVIILNTDGDTIILCDWASPKKLFSMISDYDRELLKDVIGIGNQYSQSFDYLADNIYHHKGVVCVIYCCNNPIRKAEQLEKINSIVIAQGYPLKPSIQLSGREIPKAPHGLSRTIFANTIREAFKTLQGCMYHTGQPVVIEEVSKLWLFNITTIIRNPVKPASDYTKMDFGANFSYTYRGLIDVPAVVAFFTQRNTPGENTVTHLSVSDPNHRPCLVLIHWILDENTKLTATATFRSHNLSSAWLPNAEFLSSLLHEVAEAANLSVGKLIINDLLLTARVLEITPSWDVPWESYLEATGVNFVRSHTVMDANHQIHSVTTDISQLIRQGIINTPSHLLYLLTTGETES